MTSPAPFSDATPSALVESGRRLLREGRPAEAAQAFDQALAAEPDRLDALIGLGLARSAQRRPAEAEAAYRRALARWPTSGLALRNLRILLISQERHAEAAALAEAALGAGAPAGEAHLSRGTAFFAMGRHEAALEAFEAAAANGADRYEVLAKAAAAEAALGRHAKAMAALDEAIALRPGEALAPLRRALIRLSLCDFEGGWRDYEARFRNEAFLAEAGPMARQAARLMTFDPAPEAVKGRRVLAVAEQGVGDQVMFASMIPDLARDAAAVTCVCEARLVRLFSASFPGVRVLGLPDAGRVRASEFDTVLAMGSLGRLYRNRLEDFPGTAYLRPRDEVRRRWAERLGPRPEGLRIGVSWRGGTARTRTGERSVTLGQLAPVLDLPGCEAVSLQYGDVGEEVMAANAGRANPIRLFPAADIDDFEELAGLVANLDVVVSVQTSLVHLSGAAGAETMVLIPRNAEWRYTTDREVMPWYRSARLFRQGEAGDWTPVIGRVCEVLRDRIRA